LLLGLSKIATSITIAAIIVTTSRRGSNSRQRRISLIAKRFLSDRKPKSENARRKRSENVVH
jgi:hypothetical protein